MTEQENPAPDPMELLLGLNSYSGVPVIVVPELA